jgi:Flp pilus assembly protein TadD
VVQNQQGQLQEAVDTARRLQKLHPKMALGYEVEGDFYAGAGKAAEADKAYEAAYQRGSSAVLVRKLYRVRHDLGRSDAVQPLVDWIKKKPDDVAITMILAGAYQTDNKNEDAIAQYEKVVKKQPDNAIALNNLAWLYQLEGDHRAVETAERAYKLKPEEPSIVDTLGWLLVQNGDSGRAVTLLQEAAMRAPYMPEIRYHMAVGLAKAGRKEEARSELERLLRENADFAQAADARAELERLGAK